MPRLTLIISISERDALFRLARQEFRHPREQARMLLREALRARGLIPDAQDSRKDSAARGGVGENERERND